MITQPQQAMSRVEHTPDEEVVERVCAKAEARWLSSAKLELAVELERKCGAVRALSEKGRVHEVLLGDTAIASSLWRTRCGWHFASVPHERLHCEKISCRTCLEMGGKQVG